KVPMQFFILMVGVMVFIFYQFNTTPLNFNPAAEKAVKESQYAGEYSRLESSHEEILNEKQEVQKNYAAALSTSSEDVGNYEIALDYLRTQEETNRQKARELINKADEGIETNDKDFVFIHFILNHLPKGLIGLLLAVILSAAMSSTASELNALSSTTAVDIYKRYSKEEKDDDHYVNMSKWFTLMWGVIAIFFASFVSLFDNLIQLVNFIGSIFYGTILGIFLVAFYFKKIKGQSIFIAAIISQFIVLTCAILHEFVEGIEILPFLWLNPLGAILTITIALIISSMNKEDNSIFEFQKS
ncbi:MAG: sodium:solute symporter, partial [Nonlabens sp.]